MYRKRGIIPITLVSLIIAGAFVVTGFYFGTKSGAFFISQSMPAVLFGKEIESVLSSSYAIPEDLYVTYRGPRKCSYDSATENFECARDITVKDIRVATGYNKDTAVIGFPITACLFIEIMPAVMGAMKKAGGAVSSKIDEVMDAGIKAEMAGEELSRTQKFLRALSKAKDKIPLIGSSRWKKIMRASDEIEDVTDDTEDYFTLAKKADDLAESSDAWRKADVDDFKGYMRKNPEGFADDFGDAYRSNKIEKNLGGGAIGYREVGKKAKKSAAKSAIDDLRYATDDASRSIKRISEGASFFQKAKSVATTGYRWSKTLGGRIVRRMLFTANCKEANCILPPFLSKLLSSGATKCISMMGSLGPMFLLRTNFGLVDPFYDQYIGKFGYIHINYEVGGEERETNFMFIPNGEDMALFANTITAERNSTHFRIRADPIETTGGKIAFEKHKALFDTLVSEGDEYYSNGIIEILEGIEDVKNGKDKVEISLHVNPGRVIYKGEDQLCEKRAARNVYGGKEGEFDTFCYNLSRLPFEVDTSGLQKRLQVDYATCKNDKPLFLGTQGTAEARANTYFHQHDINTSLYVTPQIWGLGCIPQVKQFNHLVKKKAFWVFDKFFHGIVNSIINWIREQFKNRKYAFPQSRYDEYQVIIKKEDNGISISSNYKGPVVMMNQENIYTNETGFPEIDKGVFGCGGEINNWNDMYKCHRLNLTEPYIPGCSRESVGGVYVPLPPVGY